MKKRKRKELSLTVLMLLGAGFALISIVMIAFVLAVIAYFTKDPTSLTGVFSLVALLLAGGVSGFITSKANGEGGALVGILSSVISASLVLAIGLICKSGKLTLGVFLNVIAFICISALFSILGKKRAKRKHRRYS